MGFSLERPGFLARLNALTVSIRSSDRGRGVLNIGCMNCSLISRLPLCLLMDTSQCCWCKRYNAKYQPPILFSIVLFQVLKWHKRCVINKVWNILLLKLPSPIRDRWYFCSSTSGAMESVGTELYINLSCLINCVKMNNALYTTNLTVW